MSGLAALYTDEENVSEREGRSDSTGGQILRMEMRRDRCKPVVSAFTTRLLPSGQFESHNLLTSVHGKLDGLLLGQLLRADDLGIRVSLLVVL